MSDNFEEGQANPKEIVETTSEMVGSSKSNENIDDAED